MKSLVNTMALFVFTIIGVNAYAGNSPGEKELYSIFDQVNGFDIETASLGVVQSENKAIRELAAIVLRDHSMVIQMARDTAKKHSIDYKVDPANVSAATHKKTINKLQGLSGKEFDKAYLRHEVEFHNSAINAVKTVLIPAAQGTELEVLLKAVLPGFEHHLKLTKKLASDIGAL